MAPPVGVGFRLPTFNNPFIFATNVFDEVTTGAKLPATFTVPLMFHVVLVVPLHKTLIIRYIDC